MGTITGGGNGLQGTGMADTSVNGSSFYKTNLELTYLKKTKRIQNTHRAILNLSMAKIVLLPLLSVVLVTIGRWFTKMSTLKCVKFKFRYLFFNKSRKCVSKHKIAYAVHKTFLFFLIALTFNVKVPSKTYYDMESEMKTYHELFTEEYFAIAESTRTNCMKELSSFTHYPNLNIQSIIGISNIYYFYQVLLTYTRALFNTHVQYTPGQLEKEWTVVIDVVCGSTKNVTHPQKTLAMIRLIFADLAKTIRMTVLTIFGSSSPLQMIKLYLGNTK